MTEFNKENLKEIPFEPEKYSFADLSGSEEFVPGYTEQEVEFLQSVYERTHSKPEDKFYVQISREHGGMTFEAATIDEAFDRARVYNQDFPNEVIHVVISKKPFVNFE